MLKILIKTDDYLMDKVFQPFANWLGREYGISPYKVSYNMYLSAVAITMGLIFYFIQKETYFGVFVLLWAISGHVGAAYEVYNLDKTISEMTANHLKIKYELARYLNIMIFGWLTIFSFPLVIILIDYMLLIILLTFVILFSALFLSCVEKPPQQKKKQEVPINQQLAYGLSK